LIEFALALSLHMGLEGDYNEIHPHIRYNEQNYIAGAYYNSIENLSFYAGKRWEFGNVGAELAAVTGYDLKYPVAPYARLTYDMGNVRVFASPAGEYDNGKHNGGLVVGVEFKW